MGSTWKLGFACGLALITACGDDAVEEVQGDGGAPLDGGLGSIDAAPADAAEEVDANYDFQLPKGFPRPAIPVDNPMTAEKVELGRFLFYDTRLSENETFSCASCHKQELAFTDGLKLGVGSTGQVHPRGSMSLANVAYSPTLTWANPLITDLEHQGRVPIFGDDPIELGIVSIKSLEDRIAAVPGYQKLFAKAFPAEPTVTVTHLLDALSSFQRTIISGNSPYDRWIQDGDESAISEAAKRGHFLFNSERFECFHCHGGNFAMTDHVTWEGKAFPDAPFHQTGLYDLDGRGGYPEKNRGVYETSGDLRDMGKFKAPTLRNIAKTAPYMHDGSIETLSQVIDHYSKGGRAHSFRTDTLLVGFEFTPGERNDMIAFLESLTDEQFLTDPRYSNPGRVE